MMGIRERSIAWCLNCNGELSDAFQFLSSLTTSFSSKLEKETYLSNLKLACWWSPLGLPHLGGGMTLTIHRYKTILLPEPTSFAKLKKKVKFLLYAEKENNRIIEQFLHIIYTEIMDMQEQAHYSGISTKN